MCEHFIKHKGRILAWMLCYSNPVCLGVLCKMEGCLPGRVLVRVKYRWSISAAWHHAWHREGAQLKFKLKAPECVLSPTTP